MAKQQTKKKSYRPSWDEFWFTLALFYSTRGTCDRLRIASVIVDKNNRLLGAGYNGSLPGAPHCDDVGHLMADGHCIRTLHSEVNAILNSTGSLEGATIYMIGTPCIDCTKQLLSKGVNKFLYAKAYDNQARGGDTVYQFAKEQGAIVKHVKIDFEKLLTKKMEILKGPGGILRKA